MAIFKKKTDAPPSAPAPAVTAPAPAAETSPPPSRTSQEVLFAAAVGNRDLNLTSEEFTAQGPALLADVRADMEWAMEYAKKNKGAGVVKAHSAWTQYKISQGWTYGPKYDVNEKKHPALQVYSGCGTRQQTMDGLLASLL